MLKSLGNAESPSRRLITIILLLFYQKLNDEGKEAVNNKLGYGAGRFVLAQRTASLMLNRLADMSGHQFDVPASAPTVAPRVSTL